MRRFRTPAALALAVVLIALIGFLRPPEQPESEEAFWARKMLWGADYDLVLAGDSRVWQGLSPEAMSRYLEGRRIINFGFDMASYSGTYLDGIENLLDPDAERKAIVLGITPLSLTPKAAQENHYLELLNIHPMELQQRANFGGLLNFFRPWDFGSVAPLRAVDHRGRIKKFRPDGFVACTMEPEQPMRSLDSYSRIFIDNLVSSEIEEELVSRIRRWKKAGIDVFAFRFPTSPALIEMEDRLSGFDEESLKRRLLESGAVWLDIDTKGYYSYDGSHLRMDHARKLSRKAARLILKHYEEVIN